MGAWGHGIFQNDHDQDLICELNAEAGMEQLEKAAEQRIKEGKLSAKEKELYIEKKLEPYYTLCGFKDDPASEEIRQHLDSGVLEKLFKKKEDEMLHPPKGAWHPDYTFIILGACAMTLGCRIPPYYKTQMQKHFLHVGMLETPERQMFKALNGPDGYKEGVPYTFEEPEDVKAAYDAEMARREAQGGPYIMMNVPAPFGLFPCAPPKNMTLRATMEEGKYGDGACGGCGFGTQNGGALLQCSKCKRRGYCGKECQKEHWKLHKKVCTAA